MKKTPKTKYNKYRTFFLPKEMVDLLLITSHVIPFDIEKPFDKVSIGLSMINDILTKSDIFSRDSDYHLHYIPMATKYLEVKYGKNYAEYNRWLVNHSVIWKDVHFEGQATHFYLHAIETCKELIKSKLSISDTNLEEIILTYCESNNTTITSECIENKGIDGDTKSRIFSNWYKIKIPIDKKNKRYLTKDYEKDSDIIRDAPKHIKQMGSQFRKKLDIDDIGALNHVNTRYANELSIAKNQEEKIKAYKRYSSRVSSIKAIKNGKLNKSLRFSRNKTNKRLDTNLTNMASDLRPFIIGYTDMAYLDLVNSQPVLFNVILSKYRKDATIDQLNELDRYREATTNGKWYETLQKIYEIDRNRAKAIWMEIAYSKNTSYKEQKMKFKIAFPFIYSIIENIKKENYANFSIELQKIESKVFIDKICKELVDERIIPYTMHDGLLVPKTHMERTKEIMLKNLNKVIGANPKIKVE